MPAYQKYSFLWCLIFLSIGESFCQSNNSLWQKIDTHQRLGEWSEALQQIEQHLPQSTIATAEDLAFYLRKAALCNRLRLYPEMQASLACANDIADPSRLDHQSHLQLAAWQVLAFAKNLDWDRFAAAYDLLMQDSAALKREAYAVLAYAKGREANYRYGLSSEAIAHYLEALAQLPDPDNKLLSTNIFRDLGNMYRVIGDFANAQQYYGRELTSYTDNFKDEFHPDIAYAHYHIGTVYYEISDFEKALEHYLQAEAIWQKTGVHHPRYERFLLESIGDMYWQLSQPEMALPYYDRAAAKQPTVNNDKSQVATRIGDSLSKAGIHQQALFHYQEALNFRLENYGKAHPLSGGCQTYVATALAKSGFKDLARPAFDQAIQMLRGPNQQAKVGGEWYLLQALKGKAHLKWEDYVQHKQELDLDSCYQIALQGVDLLAYMRQKTLGGPSRQQWIEQAYPVFEIAVGAALQWYELSAEQAYLEQALSLSEQRKALGLIAAVQSSNAATFSGLPAALLEEEKQRSNDIRAYTAKVKTEEQRCYSARPAQLEVWQNKLADLHLSYNRYLQLIRKDYPAYYALKYALPKLDVKALYKHLEQEGNTAFVSVFESKEEWIFFLIHDQKIDYHRVKREEEVETQLNIFMRTITDINLFLDSPAQAYDQYTNAGYALYQTFVAPLRPLFSSATQRLILIPDGNLADIPWSILLTEKAPAQRQYRNLAYLIRQFAISQSPNLSLVLQTNTEAVRGDWYGFAPSLSASTIDSFGLNPLYHHRPEVEAIFQARGRHFFTDAKATESSLKRILPKATLVHLATHTNINASQADQSAILLASSSEDDGYLELSEVYGLQAPAELMVLSACYTAQGEWQKGEGLLNLVRAVQYAGCQSTLASL